MPKSSPGSLFCYKKDIIPHKKKVNSIRENVIKKKYNSIREEKAGIEQIPIKTFLTQIYAT